MLVPARKLTFSKPLPGWRRRGPQPLAALWAHTRCPRLACVLANWPPTPQNTPVALWGGLAPARHPCPKSGAAHCPKSRRTLGSSPSPHHLQSSVASLVLVLFQLALVCSFFHPFTPQTLFKCLQWARPVPGPRVDREPSQTVCLPSGSPWSGGGGRHRPAQTPTVCTAEPQERKDANARGGTSDPNSQGAQRQALSEALQVSTHLLLPQPWEQTILQPCFCPLKKLQHDR